ncbi:Ran-binding protein 1 homolog b-like protein [Drosera capensis]
MSSSDPHRTAYDADDAEETASGAPAADDEEDTGAHISPIVRLEEVAVSTGEEHEDPVLDMKAKLYRFDKEGTQWKERGTGTVKFLKHKESGKVRLVMRQSKTLKICANHLVIPTMTVQVHPGNEKSCVWNASDFADGELKDELFCVRFGSVENCKTFMATFQDIVASQEKQQDNKEVDKDAADTAGLLEKLSVEEKKEGKTETESKPEVETDKKDEEAASST